MINKISYVKKEVLHNKYPIYRLHIVHKSPMFSLNEGCDIVISLQKNILSIKDVKSISNGTQHTFQYHGKYLDVDEVTKYINDSLCTHRYQNVIAMLRENNILSYDDFEWLPKMGNLSDKYDDKD